MGETNGRIEKVVRKQKGNESCVCVCVCVFSVLFSLFGAWKGHCCIVLLFIPHGCVFFFEVFFLHHRSVEGTL